ncbi:serine/threonine-protein phosphatase 6 regulatory ankyrin repeat subunit A-like [Ptychodera flava]|uniref:serine/threonine-protein phosphatase 6 regulatory ankyrin repeat subunit A-like n=1 Tax=Ptychodera flava TaxID=63121 RepID=UPI00396A3456
MNQCSHCEKSYPAIDRHVVCPACRQCTETCRVCRDSTDQAAPSQTQPTVVNHQTIIYTNMVQIGNNNVMTSASVSTSDTCTRPGFVPGDVVTDTPGGESEYTHAHGSASGERRSRYATPPLDESRSKPSKCPGQEGESGTGGFAQLGNDNKMYINQEPPDHDSGLDLESTSSREGDSSSAASIVDVPQVTLSHQNTAPESPRSFDSPSFEEAVFTAVEQNDLHGMADNLKKSNYFARKDGLTCLHYIAIFDRKYMVAPLFALRNFGELVSAGVERSSNFQELFGMTALEIAKQMKHEEVVQKIKRHCEFEDGMSELHVAARDGDVEKVTALCRQHDVDVDGSFGNTPLYSACVSGKLQAAKILLSHDADIHRRNKWGDTILHRSARWGQYDVVEFLLVNYFTGSENVTNHEGATPLHFAVLYGGVPVVSLLLKHGADPTVRNKKGKSPLDYAEREGHTSIHKLLQDACATKSKQSRRK